MIFLTPVPAIIAAGLAVPALLTLYFLKLRRRPVRVGSTMLWAPAAEDIQANVPFKLLRLSLLLLLQLLILALLLLALARPAINSTGALPGQVFIVIDRSASMRATDMPGGNSRFDGAVAQAREAVDRTATGSFQGEVTLIGYASDAQILAGPTRSKGELLRALADLRPTDEPGDLGEAVRLVQGLSTPEDPETDAATPPLLIVCSDGSSAGEAPAFAGEIVFRRSAPGGPVGDNIGFVAVAARRDAQAPTSLRIFARLQSNVASATTVGLTLRLDGALIGREAVEMEPAADGVPSQTPVSLQVEAPGGGLLSIVLDRRDALAADDSVSLLIEPPRRPAVLLVRTEESETAGAGWLLTDALRELGLSSLRLLSTARLAELGADAFEGVDLVIFDAAPTVVLPPVPSIHFGAPPPLPALAATPAPGGVLPIISWERADPLLQDVSLDAVRVGRTDLLAAGERTSSGEFVELARTARGVVLARIVGGDAPRLVSGFDLVQSTWPVHYSFPIFLANTVEMLPRTGSLAPGWAGVTGQPVVLARAADPGIDTLADPTGATRSLPPAAGARTGLGVLDLAGVWRLGDRSIPVNLLDVRESSLEAPAILHIPGGERRGGEAGTGSGEPREIWTWLLMAAAVLLALEWVLFGVRVRV